MRGVPKGTTPKVGERTVFFSPARDHEILHEDAQRAEYGAAQEDEADGDQECRHDGLTHDCPAFMLFHAFGHGHEDRERRRRIERDHDGNEAQQEIIEKIHDIHSDQRSCSGMTTSV
jgi:hypothetical protein